MKRKLESQLLFDKIPSSYILDSDDNPLEYNISSRTLEAVDSSDIEILPPGDIPEKDERTLADILIPMKWFKKEEGVSTVCTLVENYAKEYAEEYAKEYAKAQMVNAAKLLIKKDFSDEEISTITQLSIEEIKALHNS